MRVAPGERSPPGPVFWSIVVVFALSFIRRETALTPRKLLDTLPAGDFAAKELVIKKDDALHVALAPAGQGADTS